ncbi:PP2C family protein-serine/threonine phosphatase [Pseudooceanicola sp.]|uniref:PP2C family protein-serine/threonine phosphatase n=1 Tax=Pseudooceanicola sp. TaxID=1914328 RepID=UPI0035C6C2B9
MIRATDVSRAGPGAATRPGAARRVLVVDDSRMQRHILGMTLSRWGYEVTEAATGDAALEICRQTPPDIVISDWMMPGLSGPEFCRAFRDLPKEQYGYFILLTSKADKIDVAEGLHSGADDFLTKPVNSAELRARLTAGERIHDMHRELTEKNHLIAETLHELQQLYDSIDSDLLEAKKLQQSLVRERQVDFGRGQVSQILRTAGRVGGDLVGYYPVEQDRVVVYSIDVSGHGISSALMTARLAGFLSSAVPNQNVGLIGAEQGFDGLPPDAIAAKLNTIALTEMASAHYFTLALADIDLATGRVALVQAGHPHPVVIRADGRVELLGQGGFPVGLLEEASFDRIEDRLAPGDRLLLLSDGVTECTDAAGEMLGDDGLIRLIGSLRGIRGMGMLESLVWTLAQDRGEAWFEDDVSAILFDYLGPGASG